MAKRYHRQKTGGHVIIVLYGATEEHTPREYNPMIRVQRAPYFPPEQLAEPIGNISATRMNEARERSKSDKFHKTLYPAVPLWQENYLAEFIRRAARGPHKRSVTKTQIITEAINLFYAVNGFPPDSEKPDK